MRGKRKESCEAFYSQGITPADAGKTGIGKGVCPNAEDHPRGCGENRVKKSSAGLQIGSPPRMRGKPKLTFPSFYLPRITPADAGKTTRYTANICMSMDHPRGCGENRNKHSENRRGVGSPPRMRGKPPEGTVNLKTKGITPADAGKT